MEDKVFFPILFVEIILIFDIVEARKVNRKIETELGLKDPRPYQYPVSARIFAAVLLGLLLSFGIVNRLLGN